MPSTTSSRNSEQVELSAHDALEASIGYHFENPALLELARVHRSWAAEHEVVSNERLEFLGDAVLDLVVAELCFHRHPEFDEGVLTTIRKGVVSTATLASVAEGLGLGEHLLLGRGEEHSGGRMKSALLADAYEAVLGAIYLDGGLKAAVRFVESSLGEAIEAEQADPGHADHKTMLQELLARQGNAQPAYAVEGSGPDHDRHFTATVLSGASVLGHGQGRSKKSAEQDAARAALEEMSRA